MLKYDEKVEKWSKFRNMEKMLNYDKKVKQIFIKNICKYTYTSLCVVDTFQNNATQIKTMQSEI